ncbi:MAG: DUF411 domain-containing protein [Deltaproteobacteria bacterium]|nr:DUF411 domain-containing protein [Deltaproteobacteria bacterium]
MKQVFASLAALVLLTTVAIAAEPVEIAVYRTPTCGCCSKWVKHLEDHGFAVDDHVVPDLSAMKAENGITPALASCHTAFVGGYVIEGHVPADDIAELLETRPAVSGIAVPGMPIGSPGMEGPNPESYRVLSFDHTGKIATFKDHAP